MDVFDSVEFVELVVFGLDVEFVVEFVVLGLVEFVELDETVMLGFVEFVELLGIVAFDLFEVAGVEETVEFTD